MRLAVGGLESSCELDPFTHLLSNQLRGGEPTLEPEVDFSERTYLWILQVFEFLTS